MENPKPVFVGRGNVYPSSLQSLESTGKTATKLNGIFADRFIRLALFRTFEIQVEFNYDGFTRVVEPFCYGVNREGHEVLRGY